MHLLKFCLSKLIVVSNILKAKDFCTYKKGQSARIYRIGFIDQHDHVISWNKDLLSQVSWLWRELVAFPLWIPAYI